MSKPVLLPNEERRAVTLELRAGGSAAAPMIRGHAALFNSPSELLCGCFREIILPGAFTDALATSDVRALFNHDPNMILGRTAAGTLRLKEDETGLAIEIDPPDTTCGRDLQISMKRGDVNQMSFGFTIAEDGDEWTRDPDGTGNWTRTISKVERLYDVSPVTYPAYPETDCAVRSLDKAKGQEVPQIDYRTEINRRRLELEAVL
ncbi:HK97 family phage prohead protease [Geomonas nitrogeniifigens]|uniref:HK97 family phage prohead protease n=1 Tax=Geomonas diazotrophica TaxID=2843197 RepID=UPI001C2C96A6|nr:HK97 family phage prohead protease [Geomonas nitrogeniifigens]QXE85979.1 HK97 family phage prohead protease [Geomonas nitrogeniifigens]